ncbi:MAG: ribonuclease domain-containing protein [Janthinobacterium lividum]
MVDRNRRAGRALRAGILACAIASAALAAQFAPVADALARQPWPTSIAGSNSVSSGAEVAAAQLPQPAQQTLERIRAGGPFPFAKDGIVFGNRERLLPRRPRGYYREYTVPPPRWSADRGARRIVCGGWVRSLDNCYYTSDHYNSFQRIVG